MGEVSVNGIDVRYEVHGDGDRGTVLLVCGTGQPVAVWSLLGILDALVVAGRQVVTFENRGMAGAACPTPPWTVGDMADDALAVLAAVGPAHVHGVSLGALITQTMALRRPDLVRSMSLMVGGGQFGPAFAPILRGLVDLYGAGVEPPAGVIDFMMIEAMLTPEQRTDPTMVDMALTMTAALTDTFGPGGQHGQYSASATWITEDHISELASIEAPVLVIANEHDPIFPPRGLRDVAAAVKDGTYVEVPGVSHIAMDPESVKSTLDSLVGFLGSH
jgi:pimeloyl-ACP methyl ester carboxylesterase